MASDNLDSVELLGPSIMNDLPPALSFVCGFPF